MSSCQQNHDIVFGYVRVAQQSLPFPTNLFYNIPPPICNIILSYFVILEYAKWTSFSVNKLISKLQNNLTKRVEIIEFAVNNAVQIMIQNNTVEIISNPPLFSISPTITNEALNRMYTIINSWSDVNIIECNKPPANFKKYWRLADNWWNRQKGKWFGDLFFWPILRYSLHQFCKKININKEISRYHAIYFIFVDAILHSTVSFKKSKPTPLVFDLALEKSTKLQKWFKNTGQQHGFQWDLSRKRQGESNHEYAQNWCRSLKDAKYQQYISFVIIRVVTHNNNNNDMNDQTLLPLTQPALPEPVRPFIRPQPSQQSFIATPINRYLPRPR